MGDDGMLLNFQVGEDPLLISKPVFRGGRWKDRLTAKKAALRRGSKIALHAQAPKSDGNDVQNIESNAHISSAEHVRPLKRQRQTHEREESKSKAHEASGAPTSTQIAPGVADKPKGRPRQIVSSLFSYNPASLTKESEMSAESLKENVEPSNAPLKSELDTFTSLGLSTVLASHLLQKHELKAPTAIQKIAIAQLLRDDSDAFIQAETGSGKTLAYLLPIVQRIMSLRPIGEGDDQAGAVKAVQRDSGLFAIVLAPTRELCKQISTVLESLLRCAHWIVAGIVTGGEKKKSEKARLRKGINILVATPGRLVDHLEHTEVLDISKVRWLVLDEGDRLMELGFEDQIQRLIGRLNLELKACDQAAATALGLPSKRMTILCSATMKMNVQRLGAISLKRAASLYTTSEDGPKAETKTEEGEAFMAPAQLKQSYAIVAAKLRLVTLVALLKHTFARRGSVMKAIVFMSCADSVDFHFDVLTRQVDSPETSDEDEAVQSTRRQQERNKKSKVDTNRTNAPAYSISGSENQVELYKLHGSLPQATRTSTLRSFTTNKEPAILVCTDVASRGLDLPNVDFVIEFDPPYSRDEHLHRIGRTARAGRDGRALIFLLPGDEEGYLQVLKKCNQINANNLTRHEAGELLKKGFCNTTQAKSDWESEATQWQLDVERWALESPMHLESARRAYQSHIRAYATHVASERHIFNIKSLHLGHLAKAFALRDQPGSIRVPGLRPGKDSAKVSKVNRKEKAKLASKANDMTESGRAKSNIQHVVMTDTQDGARKMRAKLKEQMSGVSEFNLG